VLLNSGAGAVSLRLTEEVREDLVSALARQGLDADVSFVDGAELRAAAEAARERAKKGELDALVVAGGDGSIRTAAGVLADTGIALGILPFGTLNHFAKDLGIPLDQDLAVATIAQGQTRSVDLAEVNGEIFINNSSIGIYPYMVIDRERRRKGSGRLGKWMAMVPAFLRMLRHFPRRRLRIRGEGWARPYRTPCLFVGNNEYGTDLFTLGKRARLDAGELWLYVVKPRNPIEFFWMVVRLCFGRIDEQRDLETFRLREAEILAKASRLPVALDGEVEIIHPPLRYRSRPAALRVIVPVGTDASVRLKGRVAVRPLYDEETPTLPFNSESTSSAGAPAWLGLSKFYAWSPARSCAWWSSSVPPHAVPEPCGNAQPGAGWSPGPSCGRSPYG
jgi:diacylglycerol kinase family enzyme